MRALFCDMCGAQIKSRPAHFDAGSPVIVNERLEIIDGGDFDLCHDCAGKVAAFIHAAASFTGRTPTDAEIEFACGKGATP